MHYKDQIAVLLVAGCVSLDKGICQALLGIAAHLDSVSGNYVFTELSACELCLGRRRNKE